MPTEGPEGRETIITKSTYVMEGRLFRFL